MMVRRTRAWSALTALLLVGGLAAGCGDDDDDGGSAASGGGATTAAQKATSVTVPVIGDYTGTAEAFLKEVRRGWELRVEEATQADELGGTTLKTEFLDSRFDAKAAANHLTAVARSDAPLVFYGTSSSIAPAIAPIAQRSKLPFVAIFSGGPGVVETGDHIFRVTAPQSSYHQQQSDYFKSQGVKTVAIIYNNDVGTVKDLAEKFYPEAAKRDGYRIVKSVGVSATATDMASEMTSIANAKADAVLLLTLGQQISSGITRLRRDDYQGIIATHPGVSIEGLKSLKAQADGVIWPTDFTPATTDPSGQKFVKAFTTKYGYDPEAFAASGYDAATLAIATVKAAGGELTRETAYDALQKVAGAGFDSASGPLTFSERDARVKGVMVKWEGGKQTLLSGS